MSRKQNRLFGAHDVGSLRTRLTSKLTHVADFPGDVGWPVRVPENLAHNSHVDSRRSVDLMDREDRDS